MEKQYIHYKFNTSDNSGKSFNGFPDKQEWRRQRAPVCLKRSWIMFAPTFVIQLFYQQEMFLKEVSFIVHRMIFA